MQEISPTTQTRRRGRRIKQTAWPGILKLYQDGATLTAIARIYDCTPSAICYIVKKAERVYGDLTQFSRSTPISKKTTMVKSLEGYSKHFEYPFDDWAERMLDASRMCLRSYRQWRHDDCDHNRESLDIAMCEMKMVMERLKMDITSREQNNGTVNSIGLEGQ